MYEWDWRIEGFHSRLAALVSILGTGKLFMVLKGSKTYTFSICMKSFPGTNSSESQNISSKRPRLDTALLFLSEGFWFLMYFMGVQKSTSVITLV